MTVKTSLKTWCFFACSFFKYLPYSTLNTTLRKVSRACSQTTFPKPLWNIHAQLHANFHATLRALFHAHYFPRTFPRKCSRLVLWKRDTSIVLSATICDGLLPTPHIEDRGAFGRTAFLAMSFASPIAIANIVAITYVCLASQKTGRSARLPHNTNPSPCHRVCSLGDSISCCFGGQVHIQVSSLKHRLSF